MGLGIGLGGFVDGYKTGYGIRQQQDVDQRTAEDRAYEIKQRDRETKSQDAMDAIETDARTTFDQGVASGQFKPDDFDKFWTDYALPKMRHEMLLEGKVDQADALQEWGDKAATKKGGRLFASAMFKAQSGDASGALDDAIEAGKVQGYIDHDFSFDGKEEIKDANGNTVGFRISMKDSKGNETQQDVAVDDVPNLVATFANPGAAWESQQAKRAAETKRSEDLADYKTKKDIDAATDGSGKKDRIAAIAALRKKSTDAATLDSDVQGFDDLPPADQETAIQSEIDLQNGTRQAPVPTPQIVVDGQNGQQVTGITPTPQTAAPAPSQATGINPAPAPVAPAPAQLSNDQSRSLANATELMRTGDLDGARKILTDTGIPVQAWPSGAQPPADPRYAGLALPYQGQ